MSGDPYIAAARARVLEEAKASTFLDGALLAIRFNCRWNGRHSVPDIRLEEICDSLAPPEYEAAVRRATALLSKATELGAAFHGYPGSPPLKVALAAAKQAHPGFSENSYDLVVRDGAEGMR